MNRLSHLPLLFGMILAATGPQAIGRSPGWYTIELTRSPPTCLEVAADARCIGTKPRIARFELQDGERLKLAGAEDIPPVWVDFEGVWVYAPAVSGRNRDYEIRLDATPEGARVIIGERSNRYVISVTLDEWTAIERGGAPRIWIRVSESVSD